MRGQGRMAVSLAASGDVAAFDVELQATDTNQPLQILRVRGAYTADRLVGFTPALSYIGEWVWLDPFDPFLVWAQSDLDFVEYVEDHPELGAWATEPYDGAHYGYVDGDGAYHGPDGEGWEDGTYGADPGGGGEGSGDPGGGGWDTGGDWGGGGDSGGGDSGGGDSGGDW